MRRARGHFSRARRERGVVLEDVRRGRATVRRSIWGAVHNCSPNAQPIYVVGLQRSGTNMLLNAFSNAPEAAIHNESEDSDAFRNWMLRDDETVRSLIVSSRHRCVVFKPLADSHRVVHLMDSLDTPRRGRAIWIYRDVAGRARSVSAKWPGVAGEFGRQIVAGARQEWLTGGVPEERLAALGRLDPATMTDGSGAAVFWYVRNILFFELELEQRPDVALVSYDRLVAEPERFMTQLCDLAGVRFRKEMISGIAPRPLPTRQALEIDPQVRELCEDLRRRLDSALDRRIAAGKLAGGTVTAARVVP